MSFPETCCGKTGALARGPGRAIRKPETNPRQVDPSGLPARPGVASPMLGPPSPLGLPPVARPSSAAPGRTQKSRDGALPPVLARALGVGGKTPPRPVFQGEAGAG